MLGTKNAAANLAVKDMDRARRFYSDVLGLTEEHMQDGGALTYGSGDSKVFVYVSQFAGTNQATAVSFDVGADMRAVVEDLKGKGVVFEHYDMPMRREGDIYIADGYSLAWFKDPDGNIISLVGR